MKGYRMPGSVLQMGGLRTFYSLKVFARGEGAFLTHRRRVGGRGSSMLRIARANIPKRT
jgi:hypothetical protein